MSTEFPETRTDGGKAAGSMALAYFYFQPKVHYYTANWGLAASRK